MQEGVPAHLRTLALRKLWRLNPALANLDGLIDYGEDFTDAARVVPDLKTTYRAGKGFLRKVEEVTGDDARVAATNVDAQDRSQQGDLPPEGAGPADGPPEGADRAAAPPAGQSAESPPPSPRENAPPSGTPRRRRLPKRG